jgi:hypothetical protein
VVNQLKHSNELKAKKYYYCILVEPLGWVKTLKRVLKAFNFNKLLQKILSSNSLTAK